MTRHIINAQNVVSFFNQEVSTPLGKGRAFGLFHLKDRNQESVGQRIVVQLPVDEMTRPHLKDANCLTQNAERSAVFTFSLEDVEV